MKVFPTLSLDSLGFPSRLFLIALLLAPLVITSSSATAGRTAPPQARVQLRAAVISGSEAELQKVEQAFPRTQEAALARLLRGYLRLQAKDYATAASLLSDELIGRYSALGDYALYYRGQALQNAGRSDEAERAYRQLARSYPTSLFARTAALQAAGSALLRNAYEVALKDLTPLTEDEKDGTALRLRADALEKLGRRDEAIAALRQIYFEAPQSSEAENVSVKLTELGASIAPADAAMQRKRADKLYEAGLHVLSAQAYDQLARLFPAAATTEVQMRAAISYYKAKSYQQALSVLSQVRARTPQEMAAVIYYRGLCHRGLGQEAAMLEALAELRRTSPANEYIGDLLYEIGGFYDKRNQPAQAAAFYDQMVRQFPRDNNADEAQFYLAWREHQARNWPAAGKLLLEHVAAYGDVTDNRGKAAFWGARDLERAGEKARALTLYKALLLRYGAGWYGYISEKYIAQLESAGIKPVPTGSDITLDRAVARLQVNRPVIESLQPDGAERISKSEQLSLIALHPQALSEAEAARAEYPASPKVNLRIAQIFRARNENAAAINALKRAYPDYAQALPQEMTREVWDIFYPLGWWDTIRQEAKRYNLDPYQVAGLIRQESIFNPQARSRANALGLMQLLPSTGRLVARQYGVGNGAVSSSDLYNPVLNIQLGTAYLEQLLRQFGRFEYVAAAYNGGPTRVSRWIRELPGETIEDWVENIPLSETRLYVQGVYRNMRQYQKLYDEQGRYRSIVPE
ncbi:MAG TPA: transglycosylase SLT domain-containing protein [Blastocatellia bacterium]|nr:transglycosylase SLT domain-containing protein [Blastocatellia bacterium]